MRMIPRGSKTSHKSKGHNVTIELFFGGLVLWFLVAHDVTGLPLLMWPLVVYTALRIFLLRYRKRR